MKIPDCDTCQFYAHNPHLVCAVHPGGVGGEHCLDYREKAEHMAQPLWSPTGWRFSSGGDFVPRLTYPTGDHRPRISQQQQIELLDTHPIFTGCCPDCGYHFGESEPPVHYDCPQCGWIDDSI